MRKVLLPVAVIALLLSMGSSAETKLSSVADTVCKNSEEKKDCTDFVNSAIAYSFSQGVVSGMCEMIDSLGEPISNEQRSACEEAKKNKRDVESLGR